MLHLIAPTATRVTLGFASTTNLSPDPTDLFTYYDVSSDRFRIIRRKNAVGPYAYFPTASFSSGTAKTIVTAWAASEVKISIHVFGNTDKPRSNFPGNVVLCGQQHLTVTM